MTTKAAIHEFLRSGNALAGSSDPHSEGNGSLMRLAPVAMMYGGDEQRVQEMAALSSRTTHGADESLDACRLFAVVLDRALRGAGKDEVLNLSGLQFASPKIQAIANGVWQHKSREQIRGSGYVVESLEAALWCFGCHDNFRDAVLEAANLGDDADTTAAITGQIAGAYSGAAAIPSAWVGRLTLAAEMRALAQQLWQAKARCI